MRSSERDPDAQFVVGANLVLRETTGEVARALASEGIEAVLLRGPTLTQWLYGDPDARTSLDVDLLVGPNRYANAEECLQRLGFSKSVDTTPGTAAEHAETWRRNSGAPVDLHWKVVGANADPARVWDALRARSAPAGVHDRLLVPDEAARAALTALHSGQHGAGHARTLADLERALDRVNDTVWIEASNLIQRLEAEEVFSAGLRLTRRGCELAERLGLPSATSRRTALQVGRDATTPTATGFAWLEEASGLKGRLRLLGHKLVPPKEFMRDWRPIARRGRLGLALAYLYRPLWLAWWAPQGYLAWRRAKRASERSKQVHDR